MRIAIDIRRIEDFGVGTYIRNLIRTLAVRDAENEYILLGDPEQAKAAATLPENFTLVKWKTSTGPFRKHLDFHRLLQDSAADVLHIPYMRAAPLVSCNYLITVHDVAEFLYDT